MDSQLEKFQSVVALSEAGKLKQLAEMRTRAEHLRGEILRAHTDSADMHGEFTHIQRAVLHMVGLFRKSRFQNLTVAAKMAYDENTQFNENNIIPSLAELEEYISALITWAAYKREDPNAAISSVALERMPHKEFGRREIAIDAPVDTERDPSVLARTTADADDEDMMILDSKQLYMKFLDMVGKKQLNIVHQSQAKKGNGGGAAEAGS